MGILTRDDLVAIHKDLTKEALDILVRKNEDYGANADPFRNFRAFEELGILVRLSDKLSRLRTFTERKDLSVKDESIRDTVIDGINYLMLYYAYLVDTGILSEEGTKWSEGEK